MIHSTPRPGPLSGSSPARGGVPIGQLYRSRGCGVPSSASTRERQSEEAVDETRRNFLKMVAIAGVLGAVGGGVGSALQFAGRPPAVGLASYPVVQLQDVDGSMLTASKVMAEYHVNTSDALVFDYPLADEPNLLINLSPPVGSSGGATQAQGGVGPAGSIVAFSAVCQHLGCSVPSLAFYPPGTCPKDFGGLGFYVHCSCHGSTYDATGGASILTGPTNRPLPQVTLRWDRVDDTLWAIGVTGPQVMGHSNTLQGGVGVGPTSRLQRQSPIVLCSFP